MNDYVIKPFNDLVIKSALKENNIPELLKAFTEMTRIYTSPGDKCHMLANNLEFLKRMIKEELKRQNNG